MPEKRNARVGDGRGLRSEGMVEDALWTLKGVLEQRPMYGLKANIEHIFRAPRCSPEDHAQKDFIVTLSGNVEIPLQAKSSQIGRRKHDKKCRNRNEFIPCIVVGAKDTVEAVIRKIVSCFKRVLEAMRLGSICQIKSGFESVLRTTEIETTVNRNKSRDKWFHRIETFRHGRASQFALAR